MEVCNHEVVAEMQKQSDELQFHPLTVKKSDVPFAQSALGDQYFIVDIRLADPIRMLDQLGKNWRLNPSGRSRFYRSSRGSLKLSELSNSTKLAWSLTGESSATRYCTIAQGGPMKLAVSDYFR